MTAPAASLVPAALSLIDEVGTVFLASGRVFRAVRAEAVTAVEELLRSGLLEELTRRGLMPATWRSDVAIPGYAFVLEHQRLPVVSYPYEWSYGMLRDAAILVLEVNRVARTFGWELKDAHGFNVLFDGAAPRFVDLGSLTKVSPDALGWPAYEEFLRSFEYPLRIWSVGGTFVARRLVASAEPMSHADYGLCRWAWVRWTGPQLYQRLLTRWHQYRRLSRLSDAKLAVRRASGSGRVAAWLKQLPWLPAQGLSMVGVQARIRNRRRRKHGGFWSDYQQQGQAFVATPRFQRIIGLLERFKVGSIVELAGNQGWLSEELLRRGVVQSALCTDAEEWAVDQAYERTKTSGLKLHTAVLDFVHPLATPFGEPPSARFQAQAVLALAVTHHLLLTQAVPVERVLRSIGAYATELVFVEFMPLGLWDGTRAQPLPAWYGSDWFRAAFAREFEPVHEEQLEENRLLFCGRVRPRSA